MSRGALSSRRVGKLVIALSVVAIVAVVLVGFAPSIVSATILPGIIRDELAPHLRGTVQVVNAKASWSGPQLVHVRINGEHDMIDATVTVNNSLSALIRSSESLDLNLGLTVETASRDDGSITLLELFQADSAATSSGGRTGPSQTSEPASLPSLLRGARVSLDPLAIVIKPLGAGSMVRVDGATATVTLDGNDATVKATGSTSIGTEHGSFEIDATLRDLVGRDGVLSPTTAGMELTAKATAVPVSAGTQEVVVRSLDLTAKAQSIARAIDLQFDTSLEAKGHAPSTATGRVRVNGLLTPSGELSSKAAATGQIALGAVPTAALAPFLHGTGIVAARDLGETVIATLDFNGPSATLAARSDRFTLTGTARLDDVANQAIVQSVALDTTLSSALVRGLGVPCMNDVPVSLRVERAVVPMGNRSLADLQAVATVSMKGVVIDGKAFGQSDRALGDVTVSVRTSRLADRAQVDVALAGGAVQGSLAAFVVPSFESGRVKRARVELERSSLSSALDDGWLVGTGLALRRPAPTTISIDRAAFDMSANGLELGNTSIAATVAIEPLVLGGASGPDEWIDVVATTIGLRSDGLSKGLHVSYSGGASGFAAKADVALAGLVTPAGAITLDAVRGSGSIQIDAIDLTRVPHVPERLQRMAGLIGLGRPVLSAQFDGSRETVAAQIVVKGPAAELSAQGQWSPERTVVKELKGSIAMADGLPELLGIEGLRLAAPGVLAIACEELTLLTPAATPTAVEVKAQKLQLGLDRLGLSACPGLDGGIVLERVSLEGDASRSATGDLTWSGSFAVTVPGELDAKGQLTLAAPALGPPTGNATLRATLPTGTTLLGRFVQSPYLAAAAGPGTVDLTWSGKGGKDAVDITTALSRLSMTAKVELEPATLGQTGRVIAVPTASLHGSLPRRVIDRVIAGLEPVAADWNDATVVPIAAALTGGRASADQRNISLHADATIGTFTSRPTDSMTLALDKTHVKAAIASLESGASVSIATMVAIDGGAPQPATIDLDLKGDLRGMVADDGVIDVRGSRMKLSVPGALVQPFIPVADAPAAQATATPKGGAFNSSSAHRLMLDPKETLSASIDLRRITVPARLADAHIDASIAIGPVEASFGSADLHVERATAVLKAEALGRSCAFDTTVSFGKKDTDGAASARATIDALGLADGTLASTAMIVRAQAQAKAIPLHWVDAITATDGIIVRSFGERGDATVEVISPAPGTITASATVKTTSLSARVPRITVADGLAQVDADQPIELSLVLNDAIRMELLEPLNPILSDIKEAPPVKVSLSRLRWPIDGNLTRFEADARMDVGEAKVEKSNQLLGVLRHVKSSVDPVVPANIGPLVATVRAGQLTYKDFIIGVDRLGTQWQLVLNFSGDIDLTRDPAWARGISARYPVSSMVRTVAGVAGGISNPVDATIKTISDTLSALPLDLGNLMAIEITFSGPLGPVNGKEVPLNVSVRPVVGKIDPIEGATRVIDALDGLFGGGKKKDK
ncbi:MAG: hypothetical protein FJ254_00280 [Phycisphaerae bacterium]|nr:hypothetical protein [Phycisphaerae bacterium]